MAKVFIAMTIFFLSVCVDHIVGEKQMFVIFFSQENPD